jgi:hypothetical protein
LALLAGCAPHEDDLRNYLTDAAGLDVPKQNVDWLFDDSRSPSDQMEDIATFLEGRSREIEGEGVRAKTYLFIT